MFKNLLKEEKNKDLFKILIVLVFYLIVFGIFKAGLDFQKVVPFKQNEKKEEIKEYKYTIIYNNSKRDISFNEKKSLVQILDSFFEKNLEYRYLREGKKIISINGNINFTLFLNNKEINKSVISENPLPENSTIEVRFY